MFQLFVKFLCIVVLASTALAQNILIGRPKANTEVTAGSQVTIELEKPMALTGSQDISVVVGVFRCHSASECPDVMEVMGEILYAGPYSAELHYDDYYPYQNITVTIPSSYSGTVQLGVAHFFLLGAGLSANLQFASTTLKVVASD